MLYFCPIHKVACGLWVGSNCMARNAYNLLLDNLPQIGDSMPVGIESLPVQKAVSNVLCKEIRKHQNIIGRN